MVSVVSKVADSFSKIAGSIFIFSFVSIIFLFIAGILVASSNNYIFVKIYNVSEDLVSNNLLFNSTSTSIASGIEEFQEGIKWFDYFWLLSFLSMVLSSFYISYNSNREGYFGILSFIVFGSFILLFVGGIFYELTTWFQEEIFSSIPTILEQLSMFNFYLRNLGLINLILLGINIVLNFVDLDFEKFNQRKKGQEDLQL